MTSRYLFLTGKGGVGKTSVACAMAMNLAKDGKKVLLVSTDPASNLDDVLGRRVGQKKPTAILEVPGLWALNLDPEEAARDYREQVVGAYRGVLPEAAIASMEEQLSGACTVEVAAFDLFSDLLADPEATAGYDHTVFDTAPTGHTLRLLALPKAWSGFLGTNLHGTTCVGPLAGLQEKRQRYEKAMSALTDAGKTTLILVTRPEASSLAEAARAAGELGELGLTKSELVVNGALVTTGEDHMALVLKEQQAKALEGMPAELKKILRRTVALLPVALVGMAGLEVLAKELRKPGSAVGSMAITGTESGASDGKGAGAAFPGIPVGLGAVAGELGKKEKGVVLVMGKGGVGKTTIAAAMAIALFDQGHRVHLSTTDPAAHLEMVLEGGGTAIGTRFSVSRINPAVEVVAYRQEIMSTVGLELDAEGRELLAEDLASPCTEEIAVFRAFARTINKVEEGFVVLDTAPTGHTLLLLDNTLSYHREIERSSGELPEEVRRLLPRLRDPALTDVLIVTLPQATPVWEASRLQADLRRAGISPSWWLVNQTWTGIATTDPVLKSLSLAEAPWLEKVAETLAGKGKTVRIPWQVKEPKGREGLKQLL